MYQHRGDISKAEGVTNNLTVVGEQGDEIGPKHGKQIFFHLIQLLLCQGIILHMMIQGYAVERLDIIYDLQHLPLALEPKDRKSAPFRNNL